MQKIRRPWQKAFLLQLPLHPGDAVHGSSSSSRLRAVRADTSRVRRGATVQRANPHPPRQVQARSEQRQTPPSQTRKPSSLPELSFVTLEPEKAQDASEVARVLDVALAGQLVHSKPLEIKAAHACRKDGLAYQLRCVVCRHVQMACHSKIRRLRTATCGLSIQARCPWPTKARR